MLNIFSVPTKPKKNNIGLKLMAVRLYADWCENSRDLQTTFRDLKNKFDGEEILFVTLDFTNRTTRHQATLLASALQIHEAVEKFEDTGLIILVGQKKVRHNNIVKVVEGVLEKTMSFEDMSEQINTILND